MRLDFKSLAFGYSLEDGVSTPAWETALGQGAGYKLKDLNTIDELVKGMVYKAAAPNSITFKKGRGGNVLSGDDPNACLVIAAVFDRVFVNNIEIAGGKFVLLVIKDDTEHHRGRLKLKYGPDNTYMNGGLVVKNKDLQGLVATEFALAEDACWFVHDISVKDQDCLHLQAIFVNKNGPMTYSNISALHAAWDPLILADLEASGVSDYLSVDQLAAILDDMYKNPDATGKAMAPIIFGVKYAKVIEAHKHSLSQIVEKTSLPDTYTVEIKKGMHISKAIRSGEYGLGFASSEGTASNDGVPSVMPYIEPRGNSVNKIFYGVPGCGKSYYIEHTILGKDEDTQCYVGDYTKENIIRTTFYQDYSNTDFVGQILPKVVKGENGEKDLVEYSFKPGPFTLALIQAISNPGKKVALVIEEINRGNAPAIFGDIFQLLDRNSDGVSEYGIVNVGVLDYLNDFEFNVDGVKKHFSFSEIKIPGNLDIFATMNTSDQNVYTLDTAFTRRWAKERMPNNFGSHPIKDCLVPGMEQYTWKTFVDCINGHIQDRLEDLQINEDKQVGAFFVGEADLLSMDVVLKPDEKQKKVQLFAYKVLEYLWDDVSKLDHSVLFNPAYTTFEKLVKGYIDTGVKVFNNDIFKNAPVVKVDTASVEEAVVESN